jgi:hypothetical protein
MMREDFCRLLGAQNTGVVDERDGDRLLRYPVRDALDVIPAGVAQRSLCVHQLRNRFAVSYEKKVHAGSAFRPRRPPPAIV